jgi:predicted RNase H-like HicB family nuclease
LLPCGGDGSMQFNRKNSRMSEIIFEVNDDEVGGGYTAVALGCGIYTQGETLEELRRKVKDAVDCYFDEENPAPKIIRLHFVRDEVLVQ